MSKQMKLQSLIVLSESNNEFKKVIEEYKIPAILGIKLGILNREISPIIEEFNKSRNELIEKYGEEITEEGQTFKRVKSEELNNFFEEVKALTFTEFSIVNLIDLKYFEGVDLPLYFSDALVDFIKE